MDCHEEKNICTKYYLLNHAIYNRLYKVKMTEILHERYFTKFDYLDGMKHHLKKKNVS